MTSAEREIPQLVDDFINEAHERIDAALPERLRVLRERGASACWHKRGTFLDHLTSVYRVLRLWGQSADVCALGLFHSIYATEFVDLALFAPKTERAIVRGLIGDVAEEMVHGFCRIPRRELVRRLLELDRPPREGVRLVVSGTQVLLPPRQVGELAIVTMADLMEQWSSWQDVVIKDFPARADGAIPLSSCLWPGALRPSAQCMSVVSGLGRHLHALEVPVPPIFACCTATLSRQDTEAAVDAYWRVAATEPPLPAAEARTALRECVDRNPWVAEPHVLLAQIELSEGGYDEARAHARKALDLLCQWGIPWDKRISWQGWIAWTRLLHQRACARAWPDSVIEHNNLGFVETRPGQRAHARGRVADSDPSGRS